MVIFHSGFCSTNGCCKANGSPSRAQCGDGKFHMNNAMKLNRGIVGDELVQLEHGLEDNSVSHGFGPIPKCDVNISGVRSINDANELGTPRRSRLFVHPLGLFEFVRNSFVLFVSLRSVCFLLFVAVAVWVRPVFRFFVFSCVWLFGSHD